MNNFIKKIVNKIDKEVMIKNLTILIFVLAIFMGIDQFTKVYAFTFWPAKTEINSNESVLIAQGKLFGVRLVTNTGMFSSLGAGSLPYWAVQTLTSLVATILIISSLLSKNKIVVLGISITAAGALGNIMDRYLLVDAQGGHYVRDWIFNPFYDKGTYNIADIEVVAGSMITAIAIIFSLFKEAKKEKNK